MANTTTSTLLPFETLSNLRDLGGMPAAGGHSVRPGRLLRCGHLADISDGDRDRLAGLLGAVVDFRTEEEKARQPDREIPGAAYYHLPVVDSLTAGISREEEADRRVTSLLLFKPREAKEYMCRLYSGFALGEFALSQYRRFIDILLQPRDKGVLWHCTAGKDRAGIGAVLIQELLGVPRDAILADYLYTNECLARDVRMLTAWVKKKEGTDSPLADEALRYLFGAEREYLRAFYTAVEKRYGDVDAFLREGLGVTDSERAALCGMYLE